MIVQCMWCGRTKDSLHRWNGKQGELIPNASHSICPACALKRYGIRLRHHLDATEYGREQPKQRADAASRAR